MASGLGKSKVKMILSRHPELQNPPYSARAGGARIFFQPFIEWLAKYEGKEAAEKIMESQKSQPVTSVTHKLPAGIQLRELRIMAEKRILSPYQVQQVLGVAVAAPPPLPEPERPATQAEIDEGFAALRTLLDNPRQALPPGTVDRVARAAAGAARKTLGAIIEREKAASLQPRLGGAS